MLSQAPPQPVCSRFLHADRLHGQRHVQAARLKSRVAHTKRRRPWRRRTCDRARQEIDPEVINEGLHFADCLRGVGMQFDAVLASDFGYLRNWLDGADLIVGEHDANEKGIAANRLADIIRIDKAMRVDEKIGDASTKPFEEPAGLED